MNGNRTLIRLILLSLLVNASLLFIPNETFAEISQISKSANIEEFYQIDDNIGPITNLAGEGSMMIMISLDKLYFMNISEPATPVVQKSYLLDAISDVFYQEDVLYLLRNDTLEIYNVSNYDLEQLSCLSLNQSCIDFTIEENVALLRLSNNTITIVDISNHSNSSIISSFDAGGSIQGFDYYDSYIYVLLNYNKIVVVNITNIAFPQIILEQEFLSNHLTNIEISNDYLYVLNNSADKLELYNCSNPTQLDHVSFCVDCSGVLIYVHQNYVFLPGYTNLQIVNITNISNPIKIVDNSLLSGSTLYKEIYLYNNSLFISEFVLGMSIIEVSNIAAPKTITHLDIGGYSNSLTSYSDYFILANSKAGIDIYQNNGFESIEKISCYKDSSIDYYDYADVQVIDDYFYITTTTEDIHILRMLSNGSLEQLDVFQDPEFRTFTKIIHHGNFLYVKAGTGIVIFDVTNPLVPQEIDYIFSYTFNIYDFAIYDDILYCVYNEGTEGGIRLFDINDPTTINTLNSVQIPSVGSSSKIAVSGSFIGVSVVNTFLLYQQNQPTQILKLAEYNKTSKIITHIVFEDKYICLGLDGGVSIIDKSDISTLNEKAFYYDGGTANDILIMENKIIIADGYDGLEILQTSFDLISSINIFSIILFYSSVTILAAGIIIFARIKNKKNLVV